MPMNAGKQDQYAIRSISLWKWLWYLTFLCSLFSEQTDARPVIKPLGPNIADTGSSWYSFRRVELDSADHLRHYRIWIGLPGKVPPANGYPILYMLDGNAVMAHLDEGLLEKLCLNTPPVIVAIGYQTSLSFKVKERTLDYTPPRNHASAMDTPHLVMGRPGGGSPEFRTLLENRIFPTVEHDLPIDPRHRGIWGHSLGGTFVLDTLFNAPDDFSNYFSASPSMGDSFDNDAGLVPALNLKTTSPRAITLMLDGDIEYRFSGQGKVPNAYNRHGNTHVIKASLQSLIHSLQQVPTLNVEVQRYPQLSHGGLFPVSLKEALLLMSVTTDNMASGEKSINNNAG